jgi:putative peptidoglycan lipid II flippase
MTDARIESLKRNSILLALLFAFASAANLLKEVVVARQYGATATMDAFEIAFTLPNLIGNFLMGGLGGALVPHAVAWIGPQGVAQRNLWTFVRAVSGRLLAILVPLLALAFLFARPLVAGLGYGLGTAGLDLSASLLRVLLLAGLIALPLGLFVAVAHSFGRFTLAGLPGGLGPLTLAAMVLVLSPALGIHALAWGFVGGQGLSLGLMAGYLVYLRRRRTGAEPGRTVEPAEIRGSLAAVGLVFLGWSGGILNVTVDKLMASGLEAGRVAALGYAYKVMTLPISLFSSVVGVALLPALSAAAQARNASSQQRALSYSVRLLALLLIPATAALIFAPDLLVRGLYERKSFDALATDLTASALAMYAPAVLFRSFLTIFITLLYARHRTRLVAVISLATVLLNPLLNWVLMQRFSHAGIALSTSFVTFLHAAALVALVPDLRRLMRTRAVLSSLGRALLASAVMVAGILTGGRALAGRGVSPIAVTLVVVLGGAVLYAGSLALLGGGELREVWRSIGRKPARSA